MLIPCISILIGLTLYGAVLGHIFTYQALKSHYSDDDAMPIYPYMWIFYFLVGPLVAMYYMSSLIFWLIVITISTKCAKKREAKKLKVLEARRQEAIDKAEANKTEESEESSE